MTVLSPPLLLWLLVLRVEVEAAAGGATDGNSKLILPMSHFARRSTALLVDLGDGFALRHQRSFHGERFDDKEDFGADHLIGSGRAERDARLRCRSRTLATTTSPATRAAKVEVNGVLCDHVAFRAGRAGSSMRATSSSRPIARYHSSRVFISLNSAIDSR